MQRERGTFAQTSAGRMYHILCCAAAVGRADPTKCSPWQAKAQPRPPSTAVLAVLYLRMVKGCRCPEGCAAYRYSLTACTSAGVDLRHRRASTGGASRNASSAEVMAPCVEQHISAMSHTNRPRSSSMVQHVYCSVLIATIGLVRLLLVRFGVFVVALKARQSACTSGRRRHARSAAVRML